MTDSQWIDREDSRQAGSRTASRRLRLVSVFMACLLAVPYRVAAQTAPAPASEPAPTIPAQELTLEQAIDIALASQPNIEARLKDYAAARYRVDLALAPLLPQLSASLTAGQARTAPGEPADSRTGLVQMSQLLFDFGKTFAARQAAQRLADIAREDVELQRQLIALAVKEAYTNVLFAQRLIRLNTQALERAELNLRVARGAYDLGVRPRSDVVRAEVDVANASLDLSRARNAERLAGVALSAAMGIRVARPLNILDNLVYAPVVLDAAQLLQEALERRPEFRQAKLRAEAAQANVQRAFRDFFPDVTGSGAYGGTGPSVSERQETWTVTLTLSWPFFDGGTRIARYREANATLGAERARIQAVELDVIREVEQAVLTVTEAEERIETARKAVNLALENFRLTQVRFNLGIGTIIELTDAQFALTQAHNTEAQALADFRIALYRLDRAVGRR
jgi:outer membrane protein